MEHRHVEENGSDATADLTTGALFISYSRLDREYIHPLVQLLRASLFLSQPGSKFWDVVFLDVDNIAPGQHWQSATSEVIRSANVVLVFWCEHSAVSSEVRREYELALKLKKVVIPVLCDSTVLPDLLKPITGVDLRNLSLHRSSRSLFPSGRSVAEFEACRNRAIASLIERIGAIYSAP